MAMLDELISTFKNKKIILLGKRAHVIREQNLLSESLEVRSFSFNNFEYLDIIFQVRLCGSRAFTTKDIL